VVEFKHHVRAETGVGGAEHRDADLVLVAPATANFIARAAAGMAGYLTRELNLPASLAEAELSALAQSHPYDWRIDWYRGLAALVAGQPGAARVAFDAVYDALPGEPAAGAVALPAAAPDEALEAVVLRRGSTRAFAREPVPDEAFSWPLSVAARPVAGDIAPAGRSLLTQHVAVHAVEGTAAGAYRWRPDGPELLRAGARREDTAFLCLGQPLGGDAAYTTFHTAELSSLLDAAGARGYRAAQLAAGVASGRLQLAAFGAGVGATGLTFFDGEVARFFATTAEPMLCTAVGVPAYRSRPGRRP
jgi:hypothetical protein